MVDSRTCAVCGDPLLIAVRDCLVERTGGYTLVPRVATHVCPRCGEARPGADARARVSEALAGREALWSGWISPGTGPDLAVGPGETYLAFRSIGPPRLDWTAGRLSAVTAVFAYMTLSLLAVDDGRMLRVAAYAVAALALVWFSRELGRKLKMPEWTGTAMGWFLLVFPAVVLGIAIAVYSAG